MESGKPSHINTYQHEFEQLFLKHFSALFTHAFYLSADRELAKDMIQNLFMELWEKHPPIDTVSNWEAYLKKALHRKIVKELKQQKRITSLQQNDVAQLSTSPYEELLVHFQTSNQKKEQVENALKGLPKIEKEMLEARFKNGLSYEEIAQRTGKSKRTVYNQIHNAIKKLRKAILIVFILIF